MKTQKRWLISPGSLLKEFKREVNVHKTGRKLGNVGNKQKGRENFRKWVQWDGKYVVSSEENKWII